MKTGRKFTGKNMKRAVWAPVREFYKKNAFPAYLVRPQAGETSHKKQLSCGRARERLSLLFPVSRRVSPLRRRPKGFPVALWKPSGVPLPANGGCCMEQIACERARERLSLLFPVSRRVSPLRRRPKGFPVGPFGNLQGVPLLRMGGAAWNSFLVKGQGNPLPLYQYPKEQTRSSHPEERANPSHLMPLLSLFKGPAFRHCLRG